MTVLAQIFKHNFIDRAPSFIGRILLTSFSVRKSQFYEIHFIFKTAHFVACLITFIYFAVGQTKSPLLFVFRQFDSFLPTFVFYLVQIKRAYEK